MNSRQAPVLATLVVCLLGAGCDDEPASGRNGDATVVDADGTVDLTLDVPDGLDEPDAADDGEGSDGLDDLIDAFDIAPDISGPVLTIIVEGSLDDRAPDDGLAAQTPDPYYYGLQRLELLRGLDDANPEVVFDHAPDAVLVDMHERNEVARVAIERLPTGTFRHIRFVLTILEADVMTTLHEVPVVGTLRTPMHIVYALSDVQIDATELEQGDALATVSFAGTSVTLPSHWPVAYPEPGPHGSIESIDGKTFVTFRLPDPLNLTAGATDDMTVGIRFFIFESFRWQDQDETDYTEGEWDITVASPPSIEPVFRFGANQIEIFAE